MTDAVHDAVDETGNDDHPEVVDNAVSAEAGAAAAEAAADPVADPVADPAEFDGDADDGADDGDDDGSDSDDDGEPTNALLVEEGDIAADYLERFLDIVDYDGDIDLDVENDRAVVAIIGSDLQSLVGSRGETLDALQELTRLAVAQKTGTRSRLMLDVSGHREARRSELAGLAADTAARVKASGEPQRLAPMNPFERKVVHDAITAIDGVRSESEGEEPNRRVVVSPDR